MKTILLIEDNNQDIENVKRNLKQLNINHKLHVAYNGADAISMLTKDIDKISPDIILLDINMPKMNGFEFLRIVGSYYSLKHIKIFVIATSEKEYDKVSTQHFGASGYIVKPLDFTNTNPEVSKLLQELQ